MNNTSKNRKPGPSSEVTGVSFVDEAKLLLARCLVSLNDIDGAYYYEVIGTASIPGSLSHLILLILLLCSLGAPFILLWVTRCT